MRLANEIKGLETDIMIGVIIHIHYLNIKHIKAFIVNNASDYEVNVDFEKNQCNIKIDIDVEKWKVVK